jgi:hypothetical protein
MGSKNILFFGKAFGGSLEPSWELLGCLGAIFGGLVIENTCKKQIETHVFKNDCLLYFNPFEVLSKAILADFGLFGIPEWGPKFNKNSSKKWSSFGIFFGPVLGPF